MRFARSAYVRSPVRSPYAMSVGMMYPVVSGYDDAQPCFRLKFLATPPSCVDDWSCARASHAAPASMAASRPGSVVGRPRRSIASSSRARCGKPARPRARLVEPVAPSIIQRSPVPSGGGDERTALAIDAIVGKRRLREHLTDRRERVSFQQTFEPRLHAAEVRVMPKSRAQARLDAGLL